MISYGHFYVEHNRGHHKQVATEEDPATARFVHGPIRCVALNVKAALSVVSFRCLGRPPCTLTRTWSSSALRHVWWAVVHHRLIRVCYSVYIIAISAFVTLWNIIVISASASPDVNIKDRTPSYVQNADSLIPQGSESHSSPSFPGAWRGASLARGDWRSIACVTGISPSGRTRCSGEHSSSRRASQGRARCPLPGLGGSFSLGLIPST